MAEVLRSGFVYVKNIKAGIICETDEGYEFRYLEEYLNGDMPFSVSLTLPLSDETYKSKVLFPFFDGLIPEGWLMNIAVKNWKLESTDRFGLLLATCGDCVGDVTVRS